MTGIDEGPQKIYISVNHLMGMQVAESADEVKPPVIILQMHTDAPKYAHKGLFQR